MISEMHINRLAGALALDSQFRSSFLANPLNSIEEYNAGFARRFGERPIELNDEERQLVVSLSVNSIEQVYELLDLAVETQAKPWRQGPLKNVNPTDLTHSSSSAA